MLHTGGHCDSLLALETHDITRKGGPRLVEMLIPLAVSTVQYIDIFGIASHRLHVAALTGQKGVSQYSLQ